MATPAAYPTVPPNLQAKFDKKGLKYTGVQKGGKYIAEKDGTYFRLNLAKVKDPLTGEMKETGKMKFSKVKDPLEIQGFKNEQAKYDTWIAGDKAFFGTHPAEMTPEQYKRYMKQFEKQTDEERYAADPEYRKEYKELSVPPKPPLTYEEKLARVMEARKRTGRDIPLPIDPDAPAAPSTPKKGTGHTTFTVGTPAHTIIPPPSLTLPAPAAESEEDPSETAFEGPHEVELGDATLEILAQQREESDRRLREAISKSIGGSVAGRKPPSRPDPDRNIAPWRRQMRGTAGFQSQRPSVGWKINEIARRNLSFREMLGWMPRFEALYT